MHQKSPACLMSTDIASIELLLYFIPILTLVEVLVNVLDRANIKGEFNVNVILHLEKAIRGIENNPSVVHCKTLNIILHTSVLMMIFWIAIIMNQGLIAEFLTL